MVGDQDLKSWEMTGNLLISKVWKVILSVFGAISEPIPVKYVKVMVRVYVAHVTVVLSLRALPVSATRANSVAVMTIPVITMTTCSVEVSRKLNYSIFRSHTFAFRAIALKIMGVRPENFLTPPPSPVIQLHSHPPPS